MSLLCPIDSSVRTDKLLILLRHVLFIGTAARSFPALACAIYIAACYTDSEPTVPADMQPAYVGSSNGSLREYFLGWIP